MSTIAFSLIATVALISSVLGAFGYTKTERHLDSACICAALIWIWNGIQPCAVELDPQHPWDRPTTRHAIDWRDR